MFFWRTSPLGISVTLIPLRVARVNPNRTVLICFTVTCNNLWKYWPTTRLQRIFGQNTDILAHMGIPYRLAFYFEEKITSSSQVYLYGFFIMVTCKTYWLSTNIRSVLVNIWTFTHLGSRNIGITPTVWLASYWLMFSFSISTYMQFVIFLTKHRLVTNLYWNMCVWQPIWNVKCSRYFRSFKL